MRVCVKFNHPVENKILDEYAKAFLSEPLCKATFQGYWDAKTEGIADLPNRTLVARVSRIYHIQKKLRGNLLISPVRTPLAPAPLPSLTKDRGQGILEGFADLRSRLNGLMADLTTLHKRASVLCDSVEILVADHRSNKELLCKLKNIREAVERFHI